MQINHLINGKSVTSSRYFETINPARQAVLVEVASGGGADVNAAVVAAKEAFPKWAGTPAPQRAKLIHKLGDLIAANVGDIAQIGNAGEPLCTHPDVRAISFTGSTVTGHRIVKAAGLKKFSLELGGKSPFVILRTQPSS